MSATPKFVFYRYHPSLPAAILFMIFFIITTFLHVYQLIRTRTWFFIPLVVGGFFEWIGYIGRAISSNNQTTLPPFLMQTLLLLLAPALFAASIYMTLGRIIQLVDGEKHSLIRSTWLTKIFVAGDVFSFLLQAGGGGIMAGKTPSAITLGQHIVLVGLFVQIVFFGFFVIVALIFHRRIIFSPTPRSSSSSPSAIPWQKHIYVLYATSSLILIRSIFRMIEYGMGNDGYILQHEVFLYVFDAVLMLGVMGLFNVVHPSEIMELRKRGNRGMMMDDGLESGQEGRYGGLHG